MAFPLRALGLSMQRAKAAGVPAWRRFLGGTILSAVLWGLGTVPVPARVATTYVEVTSGVTGRDGRGTVLVVLPPGTDVAGIRGVTLHQAGMLRRPVVATGRVCGPARNELVDATAGSPVRSTHDAPVLRRVVPVCVRSGRADASGPATLSTGDVPLRRWLYLTFFKPALNRLF
jgi:hypothetical protein